MIHYPLFCKNPLEIITLFSTTLAQLHAILLHEDRWERETAASSYVSLLASPAFTAGLSPENWALQALYLLLLLHRGNSSYEHWLPKTAEEGYSSPRYS